MTVLILMHVAMTLILGATLVATPWVMPQNECFAVTVPSGMRDEEPLHGYLLAYSRIMVAVTAICVLAWPAALALMPLDEAALRESPLLPVIETATMLAPVAISFALMLHYRKKVQVVKEAQGWQVEHARSAAMIGPEEYPEPVSPWWTLVFVPLVLGMVAFGLANYDRLPDMMPTSVGVDGSVVRYVPKSPVNALFPAIVTAYLGTVLSFGLWGISHSKRPIDPNAPASSALAYGRFARLQGLLSIGGGFALSLLIGVSYYACALGTISMVGAATMMTIGVIAYVIVVATLSVRTGQAGALLRESSPASELTSDDDAHWKLGILYVNGDDPSLYVPKRFGVGWTLNFANPATWGLLAGLLAVGALYVWAMRAAIS